MFQDVCSTTKTFAGITVVFGGDFQQTLPVVVKRTREDAVLATIQRSSLWRQIEILHLRQNMRIKPNTSTDSFAQWLLDIGHGHTTLSHDSSNLVSVPESMLCITENELIENVYGSMSLRTQTPSPHFFRERAILSARNDDVRNLNTSILDRFTGEEQMYFSADTYSIESPEAHDNYNLPLEFLHTLNASGLPIAELCLKLGSPIILLRNIDTKRGLCNGTRATVIRMSNWVLEIRLLSGDHAGENALIPRITLSPSLTGLDLAIKLNRRQFPIQLAYALTINKSQGQSVDYIGIDVRNPAFAHGQLYVAFSRATSSQNIKVFLPIGSTGNKTDNIVYNEVLLN
jgi:hypothetical protein